MNEPICIGCGKAPSEIDEYIEISNEEEMSPEEYVRQEEGTYNAFNGHFLCTGCYVKAGCPCTERGWVAP